MPKVTAANIKLMGFASEMFGSEAAADFDGFLTSVIAEQSGLLSGRLGSSVYDTTTEPTKTYIARAEKCLVAVELYNLRFVVIAQEINQAAGIDAFKLRRQQELFRDEANDLIAKIAAGTTSDSGGYAGGTLVTDHEDD